MQSLHCQKNTGVLLGDGNRLVFMNVLPRYVAVSCKPRNLFFCVLPSVVFDVGNGLLQSAFAVEVAEEFLVADSVEGVEVPVGDERLCFLQQSLRHHDFDTAVDPLPKSVPLAAQSYLLDFEWTVGQRLAYQLAIGEARGVDDFESALDADRVLEVDDIVVVGVEAFEFADQ